MVLGVEGNAIEDSTGPIEWERNDLMHLFTGADVPSKYQPACSHNDEIERNLARWLTV